jgi:urease accessory protein
MRAAGATLEWLPQESIFYRGAEARTATRIHLDAGTRFIGWEIACFGLPARGEPFDAGSLHLDLELWKPADIAPLHAHEAARESRDVPLFVDRLRLSGASRARGAAWGLAGQEAVGTLLATPTTTAQIDSIRELVAGFPFAAVSRVDGVLVLRALAPQAEAVRNLFIAAWQRLRPGTIGREATLPRIWST